MSEIPITSVDDNLPILPQVEPIADPPPPYPSRERRTRSLRTPSTRRQPLDSAHAQVPSADSHSDYEVAGAAASPHVHLATSHPYTYTYGDDEDEEDASETTPFLVSPSGPPITSSPRSTLNRRLPGGRPRSVSHTSVTSVAPSLAQTVLSLFNTEDDADFGIDDSNNSPGRPLSSRGEELQEFVEAEAHSDEISTHGSNLRSSHPPYMGRFSCFSKKAWRAYFRPLYHWPYYRPLIHLAFINFPFALAAWVYLFVFTLTGTTLLVALPIGAVLCFINLLGARAFARAELALQTHFHSPISYPPPYPPRPIFIRFREPTITEVESSTATLSSLVPEKSFYKNSYDMFTDPTSYQALFYFLVIKPGITLLFTILIIVLVLPSLILVFPAPAALRAVRRLGVWQANISVEGLYLAVR